MYTDTHMHIKCTCTQTHICTLDVHVHVHKHTPAHKPHTHMTDYSWLVDTNKIGTIVMMIVRIPHVDDVC